MSAAQRPAGPNEQGLPWFIRVADRHDAAWLSSVLKASEDSPTARSVLRQTEATAARLGRPVVVEVAPVKVESFNYDWDVVTLKASLQKGKVIAVPSILMHELTHFVQKNGTLPADAFELELEAYTVDFKVASEMGHVPRKGSWEAKLHRKFAGDLDGFLDWLKDDLYQDNLFLSRIGLRAYHKDVSERAAAAQKDIERTGRLLGKKAKTLQLMRETGQNPASVASYESEVVRPASDKLLAATRLRDWLQRDMELLADPSTRRRFTAYARRIMRRLKTLHASRSGS